jgi:Retroviral aspartyl protease
MPVVRAFPLGLVLYGTTGVVLADGSRSFKYTAMGIVTVGSETQVGLIILESASTDILIGMDFLRKFNKTLFVHEKNDIVALIDDTDVEDFLKRVVNAIRTQQAQQEQAQHQTESGEAQAPPSEHKQFPEESS